MEQQEIKLGLVTYQIQRIYAGDRPIKDFVIDKLEEINLEHPTFDEHSKEAV